MSVTWTKLRNGEWGLRAIYPLNEGFMVEVSRKDGSVSKAIPNVCIWHGNGVWLYDTAPLPRRKAAPKKAAAPKVKTEGDLIEEMACSVEAAEAEFFGF